MASRLPPSRQEPPRSRQPRNPPKPLPAEPPFAWHLRQHPCRVRVAPPFKVASSSYPLSYPLTTSLFTCAQECDAPRCCSVLIAATGHLSGGPANHDESIWSQSLR